mgnify:CR=1 FL=1
MSFPQLVRAMKMIKTTKEKYAKYPNNLPVLVNYWRRADRLFQALAAGGLTEHVGSPQAVFGLYGNGLVNNGGHLIDFLRMLLGVCYAPAQAAAASRWVPISVGSPSLVP